MRYRDTGGKVWKDEWGSFVIKCGEEKDGRKDGKRE